MGGSKTHMRLMPLSGVLQLRDAATDAMEQLLRYGYLETGTCLNQPLSTESLFKAWLNCHVRVFLESSGFAFRPALFWTKSLLMV